MGQSNDRGDGGIYIGSIMKGGAVAADGRIEPGDMLLQVGLGPPLSLTLPASQPLTLLTLALTLALLTLTLTFTLLTLLTLTLTLLTLTLTPHR